MKRSYQQRISFIMTAIYLLITLSPLASIGTPSKPFFPTLAKECSGDCRLCGCSSARSASHACCCWQKKLAAAKSLKHCEGPTSSPAVPSAAAAKAAGSCCSKSVQHDDHEDEASFAAQADISSASDMQTVSISICPCGSGKELTFFSGERGQHIPYRFLSGVPIQLAAQFTFLQPERLISRYSEPPDPPPKVFIIS